MAASPNPDPRGSQPIPLQADVEVDQSAWADCGDGLDGLCQVAASQTFAHVQKIGAFEAAGAEAAEMAIRLTTDAELQQLNAQYRGQDKPTNVLSFAALDGDGPPLMPGAPLFLGDIAIAAETVGREATAQNKARLDHLVHMVVHGMLHLLGFDHEIDDEAEEMETLEREILAARGIADPYLAMERLS